MTNYTRALFLSGRRHYCAGHFPVVGAASTRHILPRPDNFLATLRRVGVFMFAREFAAWGRYGNFVIAFMSFCSTNTLARCRKYDGGIPDAT